MVITMVEKDIDVRYRLKIGERNAAWNLYYERYGGEFAEVRTAIEAMEADDGITGYYPLSLRWNRISDLAFRDAVTALLAEGNLIAAIKLCREHFPIPL